MDGRGVFPPGVAVIRRYERFLGRAVGGRRVLVDVDKDDETAVSHAVHGRELVAAVAASTGCWRVAACW